MQRAKYSIYPISGINHLGFRPPSGIKPLDSVTNDTMFTCILNVPKKWCYLIIAKELDYILLHNFCPGCATAWGHPCSHGGPDAGHQWPVGHAEDDPGGSDAGQHNNFTHHSDVPPYSNILGQWAVTYNVPKWRRLPHRCFAVHIHYTIARWVPWETESLGLTFIYRCMR